MKTLTASKLTFFIKASILAFFLGLSVSSAQAYYVSYGYYPSNYGYYGYGGNNVYWSQGHWNRYGYWRPGGYVSYGYRPYNYGYGPYYRHGYYRRW